MPIIATENFRLSHVLKHEYEPSLAYCRDVGSYTFVAKTTLKVGTLLTATAIANGADASNVVGMVMDEVVCEAGTATKVLLLARGPAMVSKAGLIFGDTPTGTHLTALETNFKAKGILLQDAV